MWYVIQTITGKEEELMLFMRTILCREHFDNSFVIYAEWMKRLGGEWQIQVRPLFPGYVFIETKEPDRLYMELKAVPKFSRLLGTGKDEFVPVSEAVVKLTVVETEADGGIISMDGALSCFNRNDVTVNLHKRYAVVKTRLLGEERSLVFGIQLKRRLIEK